MQNTRVISVAGKYAAFAVISILLNLLTQRIIFTMYHGKLDIYIALFSGTAVGLVVKYILDKRYIFYYKVASPLHDIRKFILYSMMGVVTTAIFWGSELLFNKYLIFKGTKYVGAVVGLIIGYTIKYFLDKKYVFNKPAE